MADNTYDTRVLIRYGNDYSEVAKDKELNSREFITAVNDNAVFIGLQSITTNKVELIPVMTVVSGFLAERPTFGVPGRTYLDNNNTLYLDSGNEWITVNAKVIPYGGTNTEIVPVVADYQGVGIRINKSQFSNIVLNTNNENKYFSIIEINENIPLTDD